MTLSVVGLPTFSTFVDDGQGIGHFTFRPTRQDRGNYTLTVTAIDNGNGDPNTAFLTSSRSFVLTVVAPNVPPQLAPINDRIALVGQPLQLAIKASDGDQPDAADAAPIATEPASAVPETPKQGWLARMRAKLNKGDSWLTYDLANLLPGRKIDEGVLDELETRLIAADVGIENTEKILGGLRGQVKRQELGNLDALLAALRQSMLGIVPGNIQLPDGRHGHGPPHDSPYPDGVPSEQGRPRRACRRRAKSDLDGGKPDEHPGAGHQRQDGA